MEPDLRMVIVGSQRQEDRVAYVLAQVGIKTRDPRAEKRGCRRVK